MNIVLAKTHFSLRCHCLTAQCKLVPPITLAFSSLFFYVRTLKTVCNYTYFCGAYFLSPPIDYKLHEGKTLPIARKSSIVTDR